MDTDRVITGTKDKPLKRGDYYDFYGSNSYYMMSGTELKKIVCMVEEDFPLKILVEGDSFHWEIEIKESYTVIVTWVGDHYIKIFPYESLRIIQETDNPYSRVVVNLVIN